MTTPVTPASTGTQILELAYKQLEEELPQRLASWMLWLRGPQARWVRVPLGLLFVIAAMLWFLPVVGIEFLPIGLLLLAQDIPFLRKPVGHFILFALVQWRRLKRKFGRRGRPGAP